MSGISPCKGCTDRHTACHGSCEKYAAWRDMYHAEQQHFEANKYRFSIPRTVARERRDNSWIKKSSVVKYGGGRT